MSKVFWECERGTAIAQASEGQRSLDKTMGKEKSKNDELRRCSRVGQDTPLIFLGLGHGETQFRLPGERETGRERGSQQKKPLVEEISEFSRKKRERSK